MNEIGPKPPSLSPSAHPSIQTPPQSKRYLPYLPSQYQTKKKLANRYVDANPTIYIVHPALHGAVLYKSLTHVRLVHKNDYDNSMCLLNVNHATTIPAEQPLQSTHPLRPKVVVSAFDAFHLLAFFAGREFRTEPAEDGSRPIRQSAFGRCQEPFILVSFLEWRGQETADVAAASPVCEAVPLSLLCPLGVQAHSSPFGYR